MMYICRNDDPVFYKISDLIVFTAVWRPKYDMLSKSIALKIALVSWVSSFHQDLFTIILIGG